MTCLFIKHVQENKEKSTHRYKRLRYLVSSHQPCILLPIKSQSLSDQSSVNAKIQTVPPFQAQRAVDTKLWLQGWIALAPLTASLKMVSYIEKSRGISDFKFGSMIRTLNQNVVSGAMYPIQTDAFLTTLSLRFLATTLERLKCFGKIRAFFFVHKV